MARILGIDYGRKRTGIAVTDTQQIIAGALDTVPSHTVVKFVTDYVAREPVETIVVGQPSQLYDERFTSTLAHRAMIDGGMKQKDRRDKSRVDSIAATIILNDYLESQRLTLGYCD